MYVEKNFRAVLSEFIRQIIGGGYAIMMIREDNLHNWEEHINYFIANKEWKLVEKTEPRDNFPNASKNNVTAITL